MDGGASVGRRRPGAHSHASALQHELVWRLCDGSGAVRGRQCGQQRATRVVIGGEGRSTGMVPVGSVLPRRGFYCARFGDRSERSRCGILVAKSNMSP